MCLRPVLGHAACQNARTGVQVCLFCFASCSPNRLFHVSYNVFLDCSATSDNAAASVVHALARNAFPEHRCYASSQDAVEGVQVRR
jgi:hypothetical protein